MGIQFGTDEWAKAAMAAINESPGYANAAKNWEGDFYFVIEKGAGIPETIHLYLDLWHGQCREAFKAADVSDKSPVFELSAPLKVWRGVLEKKIDPIQGLVTRRLKLKGPMMKVMKAPKAAIELVQACAGLDTEWPEA
jgi:putative sterol carrier protein